MLVGEQRSLVVPPAMNWTERAECRSQGPSKFFRDERGPYTQLGWEEFCQTCPVRVDCLAHSLLNEEYWGVWGGFTPNARRRLVSELLEGTVTWVHIAKALDPR